MPNVICEYCDRVFNRCQSKIDRSIHLYCSTTCMGESKKRVVEVECSICSKLMERIPSQIYDAMVCSKACMSTLMTTTVDVVCTNCSTVFQKWPSQVSENNFCTHKCSSDYNSGENSSNWQGGITREYDKARNSNECKEWKLNVFKQDAFTCRKCGDNTGGNLNAHHILAFSRYPEARFLVDNGATLCVTCHREFHSLYGVLKFTDKDYFEWSNNN